MEVELKRCMIYYTMTLDRCVGEPMGVAKYKMFGMLKMHVEENFGMSEPNIYEG